LPESGEPDGVIHREYQREGFGVTRVDITTDGGAELIGKPLGSYVTLELDGLIRREEDAFPRAVHALSGELRELLKLSPGAAVLVAGIGNDKITPDAVGSICVDNLMITRHMVKLMPEYFAAYRPVAAVCPGVLGTTGVETSELLRGVIERVKPDAVIVVDALASRRMSRVCRTVQLSDTGLAPGSGVQGSGVSIDRESFGVPVIALGVPTVVDARTLAIDMLADSGVEINEENLKPHGGMIVTPKEIDARVGELGKLLGYSINMALHDGLEIEDIDMFL